MRQIAIYGKGVIVKSTILQNLTATLSTIGNKIFACRVRPESRLHQDAAWRREPKETF